MKNKYNEVVSDGRAMKFRDDGASHHSPANIHHRAKPLVKSIFPLTFFVAILFLVMSCGTSTDSSKSSVSSIEVRITPQNVTMVRGTTQLFQGKQTTTTPTGTSSTATIEMDPSLFVWSIQEGPAGGDLMPSAANPGFYLYRAPAAPGNYHVVITSKKDSTQSDVAQVEVR